MDARPHRSHDAVRVRCAVLTVSDTRTPETDQSGARIRTLLSEAGHEVAAYRIVPDEPRAIVEAVREAAGAAEAVIVNGGTGLARRDWTYEALRGLLEKELPGFGELFRMLSYPAIGAAAMLTRATAGLVAGAVVFALPGAPGAVELGMTKLILPELGHVVGLLR